MYDASARFCIVDPFPKWEKVFLRKNTERQVKIMAIIFGIILGKLRAKSDDQTALCTERKA